MADKHDEITQLGIAFDALKSQPRDAQVRILEWLSARLSSDYDQAMRERAEAARARVSASGDSNG